MKKRDLTMKKMEENGVGGISWSRRLEVWKKLSRRWRRTGMSMRWGRSVGRMPDKTEKYMEETEEDGGELEGA